MARGTQRVFLLLIVIQAGHSVEEYVTGLYEVFAPARFVSGLISDDLSVGFAVINAALVAVGFWCYVWPVRSGGPHPRAWAWCWVTLELGNGLTHVVLALSARAYFPGALTPPLLVGTAAWLAGRL